MKTTFNKVLQAAVAATVLTFAGASYAADVYSYKVVNDYPFVPSMSTSSFFGSDKNDNGEYLLSVSVYEMTNKGNATQKFFVYCIEPSIDVARKPVYTANYDYQVSTDVRKLYETAYKTSMDSKQSEIAFQLALWELQNDTGHSLRNGNLSFAQNDAHVGAAGAEVDATVNLAEQMLNTAAAYQGSINSYRYVSFTGPNTQTLLGVSAVPEADTWAMMAVGLALLGMVGRRKQKNEKFA